LKKIFRNFWTDLTIPAKIFFIASVVMSPVILFSGLEMYMDNRSGIFPDNGIGLGYNEHIDVDNVELAFITTTDPHYINIRFYPHFLNDTRPNYVLFELPYHGKIQESYENYKSELSGGLDEKWNSHHTNDVTILYKIYQCDKDNPCKRPYNGNEEIHFDLDEKIDSRMGEAHTIQLKISNGLRNEAIDFLYDNLRSKNDRNPIYGFQLVDSKQVKLIVDEKIIVEQVSPTPILDYFSTSEENQNKFYEWDFDTEIAIEVNYKIPSENSFGNYFFILTTVELFLVGPFLGLLVKFRHKHQDNNSTFSINEEIRSQQVLLKIIKNCENIKNKMEYLKGISKNRELVITQFKEYVDGKNKIIDDTKQLISNPLVVLSNELKEEIEKVLQICRYRPAWEAIDPALKMTRERKMLENGWSRDSPDFNIENRFVDNNVDEAIGFVRTLLEKLETVAKSKD